MGLMYRERRGEEDPRDRNGYPLPGGEPPLRQVHRWKPGSRPPMYPGEQSSEEGRHDDSQPEPRPERGPNPARH